MAKEAKYKLVPGSKPEVIGPTAGNVDIYRHYGFPSFYEHLGEGETEDGREISLGIDINGGRFYVWVGGIMHFILTEQVLHLVVQGILATEQESVHEG